MARVEPGSVGARRAWHSSKPDLRDSKVSWRDSSNHVSSRAYHVLDIWNNHCKNCLYTNDFSSAFFSSSGGKGGQTEVDILTVNFKDMRFYDGDVPQSSMTV